jgi:dihydroflavonol-4-reductase
MRALVTGGTGFVGSAVVRELLAAGAEVRALARATSPLDNLAGLPVEVVRAGLDDRASLVQAARGCDVVYHLAALYSTQPEDAGLMFRVNAEGTELLLRAAQEAGVPRFVHTSTIGTIGRPPNGGPADERYPFAGGPSASAYARSKALGEAKALAAAAAGYGVVVVNPCAPVGPRDRAPSSTGLRILAVLQGRVPSFVRGGINFVGVRDVARGHLLAAERGRSGERYVLGHARGNLDLVAFVRLVAEVGGVRPPRLHSRNPLVRLRELLRNGPRGQQPEALTADPDKAIRELGLPQTPLREAFAEAVKWFRENS